MQVTFRCLYKNWDYSWHSTASVYVTFGCCINSGMICNTPDPVWYYWWECQQQLQVKWRQLAPPWKGCVSITSLVPLYQVWCLVNVLATVKLTRISYVGLDNDQSGQNFCHIFMFFSNKIVQSQIYLHTYIHRYRQRSIWATFLPCS